MASKKKVKFLYNQLPKRVSRKEFNRYINPHLRKPVKGPKPKVSTYKIFNYILYVLHTGIQWRQLKTQNNEIHWSNVYKWHNRWSKDGSYENLFTSSVMELDSNQKLDLFILHGDGSNTVAKKGERKSAIADTNTKEAKKCLP
jgi:transposase